MLKYEAVEFVEMLAVVERTLGSLSLVAKSRNTMEMVVHLHRRLRKAVVVHADHPSEPVLPSVDQLVVVCVDSRHIILPLVLPICLGCFPIEPELQDHSRWR